MPRVAFALASVSLAAYALLGAEGLARADVAAPASGSSSSSYAMEIAFAHAVPTAVMWSSAGLGELTKQDAFGIPGAIGGLGSVFAPPIVHWSHRRVGVGFVSLAGNGVATVLGLALGFGIGEGACPRSEDPGAGPEICRASLYGALFGMSLGQALWTPLDMALAEPDEVPARPGRARSLQIAPEAHMTLGGAWTFGVVGWL